VSERASERVAVNHGFITSVSTPVQLWSELASIQTRLHSTRLRCVPQGCWIQPRCSEYVWPESKNLFAAKSFFTHPHVIQDVHVFFSSVKKKLRFLMKTFQDFSPYNALCTGNQTVQGPRVSVQLQRALNDSRQ